MLTPPAASLDIPHLLPHPFEDIRGVYAAISRIPGKVPVSGGGFHGVFLVEELNSPRPSDQVAIERAGSNVRLLLWRVSSQ